MARLTCVWECGMGMGMGMGMSMGMGMGMGWAWAWAWAGRGNGPWACAYVRLCWQRRGTLLGPYQVPPPRLYSELWRG
jgi:hypothetical protein